MPRMDKTAWRLHAPPSTGPVAVIFQLAAWPYLWSFASVAVATALAWLLRGYIVDESLSMIFLTAVLISCVAHGRNAGILSALLAFLSYNVLVLEPRFSFRFAPLSDTLTLAVFLGVALLTGGLAGRVRDQAKSMAARAATMTKLFGASRALATAVERGELAKILADQVSQATDESIYVFLRTGEGISLASYAGGSGTAEIASDEIAGFAERAWSSVNSSGARAAYSGSGRTLSAYPFGTLRRPMGLLVRESATVEQQQAMDDPIIAVLCELGAIALDRALLIEEMTETRVHAESERLRTALLSSISHDFRTPLSGILASSTALIEQGGSIAPEAARDLLIDIRDQAERINRYVANLLDMIKLESGTISMRLEPTDVVDMISAAGRRFGHTNTKAMARSWLAQALPGESCLVEADPVLLEQAIYNVLDNAMLYSPPESTVEISVHANLQTAEIVIADEGPGIPEAELERVFDKFYRLSDRNQPQGTGLGLSICRGLIEAMGGTVRAVSPLKDGHGTAIHICLKRIAG